MIKAVFFDLDGVLINSERMHQRLFEEFVDENNFPVPHERFYLLIGAHKSQNPFDKVIEGLDLGISKEEFLDKLHKDHQERLNRVDYSTIAFKDAKETLAFLKENDIKLAVASSSSIAYIEKMLKENDIYEYFDLIVTGDDFKNPKPAPDIYLYCLKHFNIDPDSCLVIEDSPFGIQAAKSANLKVIAKRDDFFGLDQSKADFFIDDLKELKRLLR